MKILVINGSIHSVQKNSGIVVNEITQILRQYSITDIDILNLVDESLDIINVNIEERLLNADGFIFVTGTYWDSWGSPLQKFLEQITPFEGREHFFSKPVAVIVTMHSVGGKSILSRLQGVLNTMGLFIPPMSGVVLSLATQAAQDMNDKHADDFWSIHDIDVALYNLQTAIKHFKSNPDYRSWQVDRNNFREIWIKNTNQK